MSSQKSAFVVRDFTDAGTAQDFKAGSIAAIDVGAYGNYEAAELVRKPSAEEIRAAKPAA